MATPIESLTLPVLHVEAGAAQRAEFKPDGDPFTRLPFERLRSYFNGCEYAAPYPADAPHFLFPYAVFSKGLLPPTDDGFATFLLLTKQISKAQRGTAQPGWATIVEAVTQDPRFAQSGQLSTRDGGVYRDWWRYRWYAADVAAGKRACWLAGQGKTAAQEIAAVHAKLDGLVKIDAPAIASAWGIGGTDIIDQRNTPQFFVTETPVQTAVAPGTAESGAQTVDRSGRVLASYPPADFIVVQGTPPPANWAGTEDAAGSVAPLVPVTYQPRDTNYNGAPLAPASPGSGFGTTTAPVSGVPVPVAPAAVAALSDDPRVPEWALYLGGAVLVFLLLGRR